MGFIPRTGCTPAGWSGLDAAVDDPERRFPAAVSIGTNPTFDGLQRRVEAYVLDRDDLELYDQNVAIDFVERLRPTLKFDSVDDSSRRCTGTVRAVGRFCCIGDGDDRLDRTGPA